jgi:hypothetical protein
VERVLAARDRGEISQELCSEIVDEIQDLEAKIGDAVATLTGARKLWPRCELLLERIKLRQN